MSNIALQVEQLAAGIVTAGSPVAFDNVLYTDGNISYDTGTGVVTFNESGRYIVDWWVSTQAAASSPGVVFALSTSQGDFLEGDTPNKMDGVVGIGIVEVAAAPVTMSLINASTGNVDLTASLSVKATLRVIEETTKDSTTSPITASLGSGITPSFVAKKTSPAVKDVAPILNPVGIGNEPYALIIDNTTQIPTTANTATLITLSTNLALNSITHVATTGLITFQTAGVYLITATTQVSQTVAQSTFINLWLRKNGVDLADSNRSRTLTSATDFGSLALGYIVSMAATDTLELYQSVDVAGRNTGIYVRTPGAGPVSPSIIVAINYIST